MSLLKNKIAEAKVKSPVKENAGTVWKISDRLKAKESEALQATMAEFKVDSAKFKELETTVTEQRSELNAFANDQFVEHVQNTGLFPASPIKVVADNGASVAYVVQRSVKAAVSDEQFEQLRAAVGDEKANDMVMNETTLALNTVMLADERIFNAVNSALEMVVEELIRDNVVSPEKAAEIIQSTSVRKIKPQVLDKMKDYFGDDVAKGFEILGSSVTRFVKN